MRNGSSIISIAAASGMILYALPGLEFGQGLTLPALFGIAWLGFALLVIAAHLHHLLGVDEEEKKRLDQIRRVRKWQMRQVLLGRKKLPDPGRKG